MPFGNDRPAEIAADGPADGARSHCQIPFLPVPACSERPMTVFFVVMLTDVALKSLKSKEKPYKVTDRDGMYVSFRDVSLCHRDASFGIWPRLKRG
jgi:hypothetical protein